MKNVIGALIITLLASTSFAQKGLDSMIQAERNFAAYASQHNVKDAFLQFMDSSAIEVENGKPVNGLQLWTKRQANTTILKWQPQFAEIAASNDLGYTTGPWTFQPSLQDTIAGRGQFTTVWHLDKNGHWKFLVDMGTNYRLINDAATVRKINGEAVSGANLQSLLSAEDDFTKLAGQNASNAYQQYLSTQGIINRNGYLPAISKSDQSKLINQLPVGIVYSRLGEGLANSGDLGFVYGSLSYNNKSTAYLHIWRHERQGWKLALEVLQL